MQIEHASTMVDDRDKALKFYTDILGLAKAEDIPMGQYRRPTMSSPEGVLGLELVLEPIEPTVFEDTCGKLINLVQPRT